MSKKHTFSPVYLDSFSGPAADLKPSQRTPDGVLVALRKNPRISTFDLSEKPWLCGCINTLLATGKITEDKNEPYPWHKFIVEKA